MSWDTRIFTIFIIFLESICQISLVWLWVVLDLVAVILSAVFWKWDSHVKRLKVMSLTQGWLNLLMRKQLRFALTILSILRLI
ncbi:hypothetical protein BJL96_20745 [Burkholderia cenocepacia]|nr:hypothetical protein [Burkholderia cenocepacia]